MCNPLVKNRIMALLYRENVLRTAHHHLQDSLVGCLYREYRGVPDRPATAMEAITPPSILRAVVDMLVAQMLHHFTETIIERIVEIIIEHEEDLR